MGHFNLFLFEVHICNWICTITKRRNILFICAGAFVGLDKIIEKRMTKSKSVGLTSMNNNEKLEKTHLENLGAIEPGDLVRFGLIPEFIGRFNCIANCNELTTEDLVTILEQPKNAVVKQFKALFAMEGVNLEFTEDALRAIAKKAHEAGTGARALRMILETLMRDLMYDVPTDETIREIFIDKDNVLGKTLPTIRREPLEKAEAS